MTTLADDLKRRQHAAPACGGADVFAALDPDFAYHGDLSRLMAIAERVNANVIWTIPLELTAADLSSLSDAFHDVALLLHRGVSWEFFRAAQVAGDGLRSRNPG